MKIYKILTLLILCLFHRGIQAQSTFHVSAGATVTTNGNSVITLNNAKFSNNGTFSGTSGTVHIVGNGSSVNTTIEGTGTTTFNNLTVNKTANSVILNQNIAVTGNLTLTSGGVSLSNGNVDFGSTGSLLNETETNRFFGRGGFLQATAALNAPSNSNPANLGAVITSTANLGSTVIKRAHTPISLNGNGISRSFDITPTNNTGLNATLRFNYFEAELNLNVEANLALWQSTNAGVNFTVLPSTNDVTNNFFQSTGISSLSLFSGGSNAGATIPFKTTWIATGGSITIPALINSGPYNYTVNYRKKGTTPFTTVTGRTGSYTIPNLTANDTIQVEITGVFPHFWMNGSATNGPKLLSIDAWGNQNWKSMNAAFGGCSNLTYTATDNPDLSAVSSMLNMFRDCSKFNGDISGWNTSNITNMSNIFLNAVSFNQNIGSWNVSNVTDMAGIFQQALRFNQPLTNWNTAKVTNMSGMFSFASAFNQDLSGLEINAVTNMTSMLNNSGLSVANYDATLTGWASQSSVPTGLSLGAAGLKYCTAEAARNTLTSTASGGKGWTITDGGRDATCSPPAPIASAQSHCQGKTVADLIATGQNIQWYTALTSGAALATTTVLTTTTYYASQTVGGIESERTAVSVTINAPTVATVTLSPITICAGTSGTITPTITNGGNSFVYVWRINQVTQTTTSPTINYSNATGNDEYSLTITPSADACPSIASVTASVRITPLTTPTISSNSEICEGETASLTANSMNVAFPFGQNPVYQWSNGMSGSNIQVSPTVTATYTVTVTNDGCTSEPSAVFTLTVNPKSAMPTITADNMSICKNTTVILLGTCASATDIFRWETPPFGGKNPTTLTNINQRIITEPGVYRGLCESNKGCLSEKQSITIAFAEGCNPANLITVSPEKPAICPNASITLTANGCSNGVITWFGGASSQTGNSVVVAPSVTTSYFVSCSTGGSTTMDVIVAVPNITVATNISTGKEIFKATNSIQSNKRIGNPNFTPAPNVIYEAGGAIMLSPGFVAEKWSTFKAEIKTCTSIK